MRRHLVLGLFVLLFAHCVSSDSITDATVSCAEACGDYAPAGDSHTCVIDVCFRGIPRQVADQTCLLRLLRSEHFETAIAECFRTNEPLRSAMSNLFMMYTVSAANGTTAGTFDCNCTAAHGRCDCAGCMSTSATDSFTDSEPAKRLQFADILTLDNPDVVCFCLVLVAVLVWFVLELVLDKTYPYNMTPSNVSHQFATAFLTWQSLKRVIFASLIFLALYFIFAFMWEAHEHTRFQTLDEQGRVIVEQQHAKKDFEQNCFIQNRGAMMQVVLRRWETVTPSGEIVNDYCKQLKHSIREQPRLPAAISTDGLFKQIAKVGLTLRDFLDYVGPEWIGYFTGGIQNKILVFVGGIILWKVGVLAAMGSFAFLMVPVGIALMYFWR
eukprot:TRINITY_DN13321_c0_g1_i1.p1 TRINITY_DN13321_c0_g1~~TRINITY_DN13321_c0_g1_i1.p1  ORF type:complete len:383 (+),score=49.07 TRINITY_DN13321_c0_g1_i1:60-1208(+)